jgi:hypothetical protein
MFGNAEERQGEAGGKYGKLLHPPRSGEVFVRSTYKEFRKSIQGKKCN